ncbi:MAG: TonB-dependent receptor [Magnetospirillum sp.]|nr:TonB-dependent receptor [Magnetospirillum sp.]
MSNLHRRGTRALLCLSAVSLPVLAHADDPPPPSALPEMVVTGAREGEALDQTPSTVSIIHADTIQSVMPAHPSDILDRMPGVLVQQTTGEGSEVSIRQPVTTSPVYLYLEDGIPIRSTGFFNHNALYEVNLPQAGGIEVTHGPGTALQGSNAIGGVVNVLTKAPSETPEADLTVEAGSFGWWRGLASASSTWGDLGARSDLNITHTDGWREATGYDRQSGTLRVDKALSGDDSVKALLTATNIDQQTGANSYLSVNDYRNDPTANYDPIAYRRVQAVRASLAWEHEDADSLTSLTPYVRYDRMELLPSWQLTYDPTVYTLTNGSLGMQAKYRQDFAPWRTRLIGGVDTEYSPGSYVENRISTTKAGNVFTAYSLVGETYNYDVTFMQASPYLQAETSPVEHLRVTAGVRYDAMAYDYTDNLASGAFLTPTPYGNKTFYRPGNTDRYYSHLSPSVGATYAFAPALSAYVNYKHSFRAPEQGELFREGQNLDSVHLLPVTANSYEIGLRGPDKGDVTWTLAAYEMIKMNDILTTQGSTGPTETNNGKTHHVGIEGSLGWTFLPDWRLNAAGSYAQHTYESWVASGVNYSGNQINNAPKTTANVTLGWKPSDGPLQGFAVEGEWQHVGDYYVDDGNAASYGGYDLFNLRTSYAIADGLEVFARVINLGDIRWATMGTVQGGQEVLAPGMPRTLYGGITARL